MKGCISGVLSFLAIGALWILFVLPFTYDLVSGLFSNNTEVSTIAALVACVIVGYVGIQLAVIFAGLIGVGVAVIWDEMD